MGNFLGRLALLVLATHSFSAFSAPLVVKQHDGIVYFADDTSTAIARYSLADKSPLTPLTLAQAPQALLVNDDGILASYGTRVVQLTLDGGSETEFRVTSDPVIEMASDEKFIFLATTDSIQVLAKSTGAFISQQSVSVISSPLVVGLSGELFMTNTAWSPSDIYRGTYSDTGVLAGFGDSPYHGEYSTGDKLFINTAKQWVVDSSGNIYNTTDLAHLGDFGGAFNDLSFWKNLPVILRGNQLQGYNHARQKVGEQDLTLANPTALAVFNNTLFVFNDEAQAELVDIAALNLVEADGPINPALSPFTPSDYFVGPDNDTVYLVANDFGVIFRWSMSAKKFLSNIELSARASNIAFNKTNNKIYINYGTGRITEIDLASASAFQEQPYLQLEFKRASIASTLNGLLVWDIQNNVLHVFDKNKNEKSSAAFYIPVNNIYWSEDKHRVYLPTYNQVYSVSVSEGGAIGAVVSGSYLPIGSWADPMRISENSIFLSSSAGVVVDSNFMRLGINIGVSGNQPYTDVAWLHGNLFSLTNIDNGTYGQLNRWLPDASKDVAAFQEIKGNPLGLLPVAAKNTLLLIYSVDGIVQFKALNFLAGDFDLDGYLDSIDEMPADASDWQDYDADGIGNSADNDDDNDGVDDQLDAFPFDINESEDTDGDGIGNVADDDDDNDGVKDDNDRFPLDATESADADYDNIGDNADPDDDNDGINDVDDAFPLDRSEWLDTDGDGIGNNQDDDDDNDGVLDYNDTLPLNALESIDTDNDGIGNNTDDDDDGDGVLDSIDAFPLSPWESLDSDGDGIGNNQDDDDDNDGVADYLDALPLDATESLDSDADGVGNNKDTDDDGDGVLDVDDAFPLDSSESVDTDKDGIGNNADYDDDNDGLFDTFDFYPLDPLLKFPDLTTYFPAQAGNQWRFVVNAAGSTTAKLASTKTVAGQKIAPLEFNSGAQIYLASTKNAINFYGLYLPTLVTGYGNYSTDIQLATGVNVLVKDNFIGTGTVDIKPKYGKKNMSWNAQVNYQGIETITTPAGTYKTVHTILELFTSADIDGGSFGVSYAAEFWFAENVGIVQMRDASGEFKLQSFTAGTGQPTDGGSTSSAAAKSGGGGSLGIYGLLSLLLLVFTRRRLLN